MNIQELKQAVEKVEELIDVAENDVEMLEENLDFAEAVLETLEERYETLIEELYSAQQKEIAERGVK